MSYTLITGASSGIGFELAKVFARNRHDLILVARSADKLLALKNEVEKDFNIKAEVIIADLSQPGSAEKLFSSVQNKNYIVDVLVNNAGFGTHGAFVNIDLQKTQEMIHLNITTLSELTRLFLPSMLARRTGKILNVASTAAFQPGPYLSVYYATKAYVLHFSEGLFEELRGSGVTVTALCPGPTISGFQATAKVEKVAIFNLVKMPSSLEVAEFGYNKLMAGKAIAIHGFMNKLATFSARLTPRAVTRKVVMSLQKID